ncbi:MAG: SGNH/GDSL hydrolase family protein [Clostridiales bacterium]|nr:SGNH/GDSL hydrolase family protein [Clostridiales bacterium]
MTKELKDSELFEDLQSGKTICFVGDSITSGAMTDGVTWYDPLVPYIEGDIRNFSHSRWTTGNLLEHRSEIPEADVYVIAIGINDVIFIDDESGAASGEEYISNLEILDGTLNTTSPGSKRYYITPWILIGFPEEYNEKREEFSESLYSWCNEKERICIDPFPVIDSFLEGDNISYFMHDAVHPNDRQGVQLFSYAVLYQDHQRRSVS